MLLCEVLTEGKRATSVTASSFPACMGRREKLGAAQTKTEWVNGREKQRKGG